MDRHEGWGAWSQTAEDQRSAYNAFVRGSGSAALIANPVGTRETLQLVNLGNGNVALKARANGKYVCADNVLIDHTWVWRADHGVEGFTTPSAGTPTSAAAAPSSTATT
ncbi:hypothetical protein ACQP2K_17530 [Microbispora siamensis]